MTCRKSCLVLFLAATAVFWGCSDDETSKPSDPVDQFEVVREALDAYVAGNDAPVVLAQALFDNMNDGDDTNDYFVLSVRNLEHYNVGHVPGAVNIPWREAGDQAKLSVLPGDQPIAVYCYSGHTAAVVTTLLQAIGYEAYNMKFGMMAWTKDPDARVQNAFNEEVDANEFLVETTANTPATYDLPELDVTSSTDTEAIILAAANEYLVSTAAPVVLAQALFDNMNDGDDTNDYYVISVRSEDHYAIGHIPGAIVIPWRTITSIDNLKKIPADKPIVVYCYSGHTAGVATMALRMLGYEAYNMKFGMMAWTKDPDVRVQSAFNEATDANEFPVESTGDFQPSTGGNASGPVASYIR